VKHKKAIEVKDPQLRKIRRFVSSR